MKIIHIVDSLPNYVGGVSDYAYKLSSELKDKHNIDTFFITVKSFSDYDRTLFDTIYNIYQKKDLFETVRKIIDEKFEKEEKVKIVLEYVGYGYQKKGCPIWLLLELKKIKKTFPNLHIITMFHELYAVSKDITSSTFYLSWLQKYITKEIFYLSDEVKTNTLKYRNEMKTWDKSKIIEVLPVFSNIGETENIIPFHQREEVAIIFGTLATRQKVYEQKDILKKWIKVLGIKKIIDIGPGLPDVELGDHKIDIRGKLNSIDIEKIMNKTQFGFLAYGNGALEKSGVFAAYAAQGICPIVLQAYCGQSIYEKKEDYLYDIDHLPINAKDISWSVRQKYLNNASVDNHVNSFLKGLL